MRKLLITLFSFYLIFLPNSCAETNSNSPFILAIDSNHDGKLNVESIKSGQDLFLVRQNPTKLKPHQQTFMATQNAIYVSATPEDLALPNAFKFLQLARMTEDGTIKVTTLANNGYTQIDWIDLPNGNKTAYLVSPKGRYDRIYLLPFQAPMMKNTTTETASENPKKKK